MAEHHIPHISMRNVKTALSVGICILIFQLLGQETPFYACISAVICLKTTVQSTLKGGKDRVIGTALGGVAGVAAMFLLELIGDTYSFLIFPILIMILIYFCNLFKIQDSISIACVVLLSVIITHRPEGLLAYQYVLSRCLETLFGVVVAFAVNASLFKLQGWWHNRKQSDTPD